MSDIDFESDSNSDSEYESDFDTDSDTNSESNPTPKITPNLVPNSSKKYSPVRYRNSSPSVSIESSFSSTSQNLEDDDIIEDPEKDSDQGFEHLCVSNLECIQKDCIICYKRNVQFFDLWDTINGTNHLRLAARNLSINIITYILELIDSGCFCVDGENLRDDRLKKIIRKKDPKWAIFENLGYEVSLIHEVISSNKWMYLVEKDPLKSKIVSLLIKSGANPNHQNYFKMAADRHLVFVAQTLVKNGLDVNNVNSYDLSLLQLMVRFGKSEFVRILLNNGADLSKTSYGDYSKFISRVKREIGDKRSRRKIIYYLLKAHNRIQIRIY